MTRGGEGFLVGDPSYETIFVRRDDRTLPELKAQGG